MPRKNKDNSDIISDESDISDDSLSSESETSQISEGNDPIYTENQTKDQEKQYVIHEIRTGNQRITSEYLTIFEYVKLISEREKMLEMDQIHYADIPKTMQQLTSAIIAEMEIKQGKCPLLIRRKVGENCYEQWRVKEMILPDLN